MPDTQDLPTIIRTELGDSRKLVAGEVHLYVVRISEQLNDEAELSALLSQDEHDRAGRFLNPQHGRNYRCMRGLLRKLLGGYLDIKPQAIQFDYAEHGKPYLTHNRELQFNMSHSRDRAAYAFCLKQDVGVDIEFMRPQKNLQGMIGHVGSPQEQTELQQLDETQRLQAFYRLWTRKEAFIKAVGRGLGMGLRSIYIGSDEDSSPRGVEYKNEPLAEWLIQDIAPPDDYKLAICNRR
jgi:4'-phosphopantetheinyl transferase